MTHAGERNHRDLLLIIDEAINTAFAGTLAFVYLPGDVADHGSAAEYEVVRRSVSTASTVPWCCIVGDHDVHEKSFANFLHSWLRDALLLHDRHRHFLCAERLRCA